MAAHHRTPAFAPADAFPPLPTAHTQHVDGRSVDEDEGPPSDYSSPESEGDVWDPDFKRWITRHRTPDGLRCYRPTPAELARIHRNDPRTVHQEIVFVDDDPFVPPDGFSLRPSPPMPQSHSHGGSPPPRGPPDFSGASDDGDSDGGSDDSRGNGRPPAYGQGGHPSHPSAHLQGQWQSLDPALAQPPPNVAHNRQHYPAYDEYHRIGLEHVRNPTGDHQGDGQYYQERTHNYPSGMTANFPHVMSVHIDQPNLPQLPRKRNAKQKQREEPLPNIEDLATASTPEPVPGEQGASDDATDASPILRAQLGLPANVPINLDCLRDPPLGARPDYPYTTLVQLAIYGSPNKRLTLSEIYTTLEQRYEWFRDTPERQKWQVRAIYQCDRWIIGLTSLQGSIRHMLSLNKIFRRVARPMSCPGKGDWWTVDYSHGEGNKRERKRGPKLSKAELRRQAEEEDDDDEGDTDPASDREREPQPGPSRGFPHGFVTKFRSVPAPAGKAPPGLGADSRPAINPMFIVKTAPPFNANPPAGPSPRQRAPAAPPALGDSPTFEDWNIDPALRDTGHVVGEGRERRARSTSRQTASPYTAPTPIRRSARLRGQDAQMQYDSHSPSVTPEPAGPAVTRPPPQAVFGQPSFGGGRMPVNSPFYPQNQQHAGAGGLPLNNALGLGVGVGSPGAAAGGPSSSPPMGRTHASQVQAQAHPQRRSARDAAGPGRELPSALNGGQRTFAGKGRQTYRDQGSNSDYEE
ncbi:hypothetical protein EIP86_001514 [Pleurotus ostreatoroseus]|nr:hypothetical protein EIP86_001514 [Pleurotus ostreatoroseus]